MTAGQLIEMSKSYPVASILIFASRSVFDRDGFDVTTTHACFTGPELRGLRRSSPIRFFLSFIRRSRAREERILGTCTDSFVLSFLASWLIGSESRSVWSTSPWCVALLVTLEIMGLVQFQSDARLNDAGEVYTVSPSGWNQQRRASSAT